jgi:hypothetical protein
VAASAVEATEAGLEAAAGTAAEEVLVVEEAGAGAAAVSVVSAAAGSGDKDARKRCICFNDHRSLTERDERSKS